MFQVFRLTTLVILVPVTRGGRFKINLDRVAFKEVEVRGVLFCLQVFVRIPRFTRRSFLSESSLTILSESVVIADSIRSSRGYAPRSVLVIACAVHVVSDLVLVGIGLSCAVALLKIPVKLNIIEARGANFRCLWRGGLESVPVASLALGPPGPSKSRSSPSKRMREISRSLVKLPQESEISSPPSSPQKQSLVEDPSFASALTAQFRRSGRDRRAAHCSRWAFHKDSLLYLISLFSFFSPPLNCVVFCIDLINVFLIFRQIVRKGKKTME